MPHVRAALFGANVGNRLVPQGISVDLAEIPWGFSGDSVGISLANRLIPLNRAKDYK